MRKSIILLLLLSGCINPMCNNPKAVYEPTYSQCMVAAIYVPGRMGIVPQQEMDDCAYKAYLVKQQICGVK